MVRYDQGSYERITKNIYRNSNSITVVIGNKECNKDAIARTIPIEGDEQKAIEEQMAFFEENRWRLKYEKSEDISTQHRYIYKMLKDGLCIGFFFRAWIRDEQTGKRKNIVRKFSFKRCNGNQFTAMCDALEARLEYLGF